MDESNSQRIDKKIQSCGMRCKMRLALSQAQHREILLFVKLQSSNNARIYESSQSKI